MKKLALALVLFSALSIGVESTSANAENTKTNQNVNSSITYTQKVGMICTPNGVNASLRESMTGPKVLLKLRAGTMVKLLSGVISGWYKVQYNGTTGYVDARCIRVM